MKIITTVFLISFCLIAISSAETFLNPDADPAIVSIPADQVAIFEFPRGGDMYATHSTDGPTCTVAIRDGSMIPGPCTLNFGGGNAKVGSYHFLALSSVTKLILGAGQSHALNILNGKTIKILPCDLGIGTIGITRGTKSVVLGRGDVDSQGLFLTGPLTVTFNGTGTDEEFLGHPYKQLFCYYLTEDTFQITETGLINGPTGSFEILLEKSVDLFSWTPLMVHNTKTDDTRAFYRIRIAK